MVLYNFSRCKQHSANRTNSDAQAGNASRRPEGATGIAIARTGVTRTTATVRKEGGRFCVFLSNCLGLLLVLSPTLGLVVVRVYLVVISFSFL